MYTVADAMTPGPISVGPDARVGEAEAVMIHARIRHLPVVHHGQVLGVVSIGDLVKAVIEDQQLELDQLQRYIAS